MLYPANLNLPALATPAGLVHINVLEFIIVLLQLAAAITRDRDGFQVAKLHPICPLHKLLIRSDNSPSRNWAHKMLAKSERGQLFVSIYAKLLDQTYLTVDCSHIAGIDNNLADFISRSLSVPISHQTCCQQIFQEEPRLHPYCFFRPHPNLIFCLMSRLSTTQWQVSRPLPKSLGRFEIVNCTISSSVFI